MKKLVFIVVLINSLVILGQDKKNITFDLKNKKLKIDDNNIRSGKSYMLEFNNINTSFMQIKIEGKSYSLISNIPDVLKPIFPGISNISDLLKNKTLQEMKIDSANIRNSYDAIYLNVKIEEEKLNTLKNEFSSLYNYASKTENYNKTDSIITKAINSLDTIFKVFKIKNNSIIQDDIKKKFPDLKNEISKSINYIIASSEFFKNRIEKARTADIVYYSKLLEYYSDLLRKSNDLQKTNYMNFFQFITKAMTMSNTYEYKKAVSSKKDILDVKVIIINSVTKDTILKEVLTFRTYNGGLKFDFSTGFFYNNIIEKQYFTKKRNDTINNVLEENGDNFDISIGGLMHFSYQFSGNFRGGISTGLAVSPLDGKTRYLFGFSGLIGKEKLFGFNIGAAVSRINVLSGSVMEDSEGFFVPSSVTSTPTSKKTEWGFFFGLTYNLTRQKKK